MRRINVSMSQLSPKSLPTSAARRAQWSRSAIMSAHSLSPAGANGPRQVNAPGKRPSACFDKVWRSNGVTVVTPPKSSSNPLCDVLHYAGLTPVPSRAVPIGLDDLSGIIARGWREK